MKKANFRRKRAFTLVELLVVIMIIGVLAAMLIPTITSALCAGREATAEAMIGDIKSAAKMYYADFNTYPTSDQGTGSSQLMQALTSKGTKTRKPYMANMILDTNGNLLSPIDASKFFMYEYPGKNNIYSFDIWTSNCEDVADGINNWGGE